MVYKKLTQTSLLIVVKSDGVKSTPHVEFNLTPLSVVMDVTVFKTYYSVQCNAVFICSFKYANAIAVERPN